MARKAQVNIWIAGKPFDLAGEHYEPGDEWMQPQDWERDEEFEARFGHVWPVFAHDEQVGVNEKRKPEYVTKHVILPVKPKE
jgi:hypothetical protein